MVLSNKKLKQKLRAELAKSLSESVAGADSNKDPVTESQTQSLKLLLDSATRRRPRLSKREKRRETVSLLAPEAENGGNRGEEDGKGSGSEGLPEKKRKRKREEGNGDVLGSEGNGVVKKSKKKKKNKNKKNNKGKNEEGKEAAKLGNEEQMVMETNEKIDRYF